jgi:hypothetical protein
MAAQATITYDTMGREAAIKYSGLPICEEVCEEPVGRHMTKFPFNVTCEQCSKQIRETMNEEYRADKAARDQTLKTR